MPGRKSTKIYIVSIIAFLIFLVSMRIGRYKITLKEIFQMLFAFSDIDFSSPEASVFFYIRLPRIFLAMMVGAALSASGSLFQGIFRNPLVSPDILGVTSGCSFGAALGILLPGDNFYMIGILAFVFGLTAMLLAYGISGAGKSRSILMLILGGIIVSAFFSAALSLMKYIADPLEELPAIVFWIMGGFYRANWYDVINVAFFIIPGIIILILLSWRINLISIGDEEASSLGINVERLRFFLITVATFMVAASVSVTGTISWVGLVIPHISRLIIGSDHKYSLALSAIIGAAFVMLMDNLARSIISSEIPISILTAALGAPFFAYLLIKNKENLWKQG